MNLIVKPRARLTAIINPAEVVVPTLQPVLLADITKATQGEGCLVISVMSSTAIFVAFGTSATQEPGLTAAKGVQLPGNGIYFFDDCGGMAIWAIASTIQSAGTATRVSGGYVDV